MKLQLRELAQLFNSMDPSPFHDRDLDADAEEFILNYARELPAERSLELIIHLTTPPANGEGDTVQISVRRYFATRAKMKQRELRFLLRQGRVSLLVGLVFLVLCLATAELLETLGKGTLASIVKEGLTIAGWVAMWRPLQTYLYDWWPLRHERKLLQKLSRMKVRLVPAAAIDAGEQRLLAFALPLPPRGHHGSRHANGGGVPAQHQAVAAAAIQGDSR
jgi:hypothetical protein